MTIATQTQKDQVEARLCSPKKTAEIFFIIFGSLLCGQFPMDAVDIFARDGNGLEQGLIRHVEIAVIVVSRNAAFISPKEMDPIPTQVSLAQLGVHQPRCGTTSQCYRESSLGP